ncbi:MAG: ribosome biogenesis GTP-binding protein YihA/YsxC [Pseudomonadota bacterium]|nr:ribosome biogenesis GTP-binding protein YihA/YsxC [Pseudomonadota bacterium]
MTPKLVNPFAGARFLLSCAGLEQLPEDRQPEFAFAGRSNAGKSSALNRLCGHNALARVSKTPGRTQLINLFEVPGGRFADLPGYGYAAVERAAKLRWQEVMANYLQVRRNLEAVVLLADSRLGVTANDRILLDLIAPRLRTGAVKLLVLLTKADKLSRRESDAAVAAASQALARSATEQSDISLVAFSATRGTGVGDAAELVESYARAAKRADR